MRRGNLARVAGAAILLLAAGPPPRPATVPPDAESNHYAQVVGKMLAAIEDQYFRPVQRIDLLRAAVRGLYDAAGRPMPASVSAEIERTSDLELEPFLARQRQSLGDVPALRNTGAIVASARALPAVLDPYCGVVSGREFIRDDGSRWGLGLELADAAALTAPGPNDPPPHGATPWRVSTVTPGSPAQRAGLRPGDLLLRIGNRPAHLVSPASLAPWLHPPMTESGSVPATPVVFRRPGETVERTADLAPTAYALETIMGAYRRADGSWEHLLDRPRKLGYVRIGAITGPAHDELGAALEQLMRQEVRGMLLDLRGCPGGSLDSAAGLARSFLPAGSVIAYTQRRHDNPSPVQAAQIDWSFPAVPVVVLVDADTMGGGELVAAVLQDHGRVIVCGERTFGKGTVQSLLLDNDSGVPFKISAALLVRPNGSYIQRLPGGTTADVWGVRPDAGRELPSTPERRKQLKQWYQWQQLRPAESREALPLDEPQGDPVREAALEWLAGAVVGSKSGKQ